jgi:hypothetical protein
MVCIFAHKTSCNLSLTTMAHGGPRFKVLPGARGSGPSGGVSNPRGRYRAARLVTPAASSAQLTGALAWHGMAPLTAVAAVRVCRAACGHEERQFSSFS